MVAGRDIGIADRLRAAGLTASEVDGWKTRGSAEFRPRGLVLHHTAGAPGRPAPSLNTCINGRTDLPGPLCHVLIGRDGVCHVIAAGRAHHAGKGGWQGLTGNSSVYGIEVENVGTEAEPWTEQLLDVTARAARAIWSGNVDMVCMHKEWAPGRKVDMHTITGPQMRARIAALLHPAVVTPPAPSPTPEPPAEDDTMPAYLISDGRQVWWTDYAHLLPVTAVDEPVTEAMAFKLKRLGFLRLASNQIKEDGVPEIPVLPDFIDEVRAAIAGGYTAGTTRVDTVGAEQIAAALHNVSWKAVVQ